MLKIIFFSLFIILNPIFLFADLFHLNGKFIIQDSKVNTNYTIPINSPTENLTVTLYHLTNFTNGVNKQIVSAYKPIISPKPDNIKNFTDSYGNTGLIISYNYIKSDIRVESNYIFDSIVDLSRIDEYYDYPLNSSSTRHVSPFLKTTQLTSLQNKKAKKIIAQITKNVKTQTEVVTAIIAWIKNNIKVDHYIEDESAGKTFILRKGNHNGVLNLTLAFLRMSGIPARFVNGLSINQSYVMLKKEISNQMNSNESPRSHMILLNDDADYNYDYQYPKSVYNWIEIYFPNRDWVPFDPFSTLFFVPCNLLRKNIALDSSHLKDEAIDEARSYEVKIHFFSELNSIGGKFKIEKHSQNNVTQFMMPTFTPKIDSYIFQIFKVKENTFDNGDNSFTPHHLHIEHNNQEYLDLKILDGIQFSQSFYLNNENTLSGIQLPLFRFNNAPQGKIWIEIYSDPKDFLNPKKVLVQSKELDVYTLNLSGNYHWIRFTLNENKLKKGRYWILLRQNTQEIILWRGIFANYYNGIKDTLYFFMDKPGILYSPYFDLCFKLEIGNN